MFHHGWLSNCTKIPGFQYPPSTEYRICCATRRGIHCSWSVPKPSLDDALSWWYELPYASFRHSWVSPRHFPPRLTLKMHTKCQILSTLSVQKMGCHYTMRGIHCLWSVSKPSLDLCDRWEELLCASSCHLRVTLSHYVPWRFTLELLTKMQKYTLSIDNIGCWTARRDIHSVCIV